MTFLEKLTVGKIIRIDATRCLILRLKCTKSFVGCGSVPDPAGELAALPRPLAGFNIELIQGLLLKGGKGRGGGG